jgi:phosphate-selective porin OprO/OprP
MAALALGAALAPAAAVEIEPRGRLHVDHATHRSDRRVLEDGFVLRRASLGLDGTLGDAWSFEIAYDFADGGAFKDAYLRYTAGGAGEWTVGQFKVPFGLEELSSSNDIAMIERALPGAAFAPSRRMGIAYAAHGRRHGVSAMAFGATLDGEGGHGVAARATYAPVASDATVLHFGAAALTERPDGPVGYNPRPESAATDARLVDTGRLEGVQRIAQLGLEAAWKSGPLSVQTEWMHARLNRADGLPDAGLHGWYAMAGWVLTGESRGYRAGAFKDVRPARRGGAWELTARYSRIDLDDADVRGGVQRNATVGLNWYANAHVRVMLNYIQARSERRGASDDPAIYLVRTQVVF